MNDLMRKLLFLPPQASTVAQEMDLLHYAIILITMIGAGAVGIVALGFLIRYRAGVRPATGPSPRTPFPIWLEAFFITVTLGIFVLAWQISFLQFMRLNEPPKDSLEVYVTGKQWMWKYAYPNGPTSISVLYVPTGRPVKLIMTSRDVIHSFYVADFRIKMDVIPGRYTTAWFEVKEPGVHEVLCTEYCGAGHSTMRGQVVALAPDDWESWLNGALPAQPPAAMPDDQPFVVVGVTEPRRQTDLVTQGRQVAVEKGCLRCHSVDGGPHLGPTWAGLYGARRQFTDGTTVMADEAYLTASMMDPFAKMVVGYGPIMPTYQGLLQPAETAALVEYIKSLSRGQGGPHGR